MPPRIEFFERSELSTAQREYRDYSIRNVRNAYGNKNRNFTNDSDNPLIDDFNNFVEESHAPSFHDNGIVNQAEGSQTGRSSNNSDTFKKSTIPLSGGLKRRPSPTPPAKPSAVYAHGSPYLPPNDSEFTSSSTAILQHQGTPQRRGSPHQHPPHRRQMPQGNQALPLPGHRPNLSREYYQPLGDSSDDDESQTGQRPMVRYDPEGLPSRPSSSSHGYLDPHSQFMFTPPIESQRQEQYSSEGLESPHQPATGREPTSTTHIYIGAKGASVTIAGTHDQSVRTQTKVRHYPLPIEERTPSPQPPQQ